MQTYVWSLPAAAFVCLCLVYPGLQIADTPCLHILGAPCLDIAAAPCLHIAAHESHSQAGLAGYSSIY